MKQRIAIIGSGISGLTVAYRLTNSYPDNYEVTLYEANGYLGGHTHTVDVALPGQSLRVDTGFIVCNDRNYPRFLQLMDEVGIKRQATQMSFSVVSPERGLEYNGHNLDTLFAQRRNILRPKFLSLVNDILRFNKAAKGLLAGDDQNISGTLDDFLRAEGFSGWVRDCYVLPMTAAIWSCSTESAGQFPLQFFLQFFSNHGLLDIKNRPQWYVIEGGSSAYIEPLTQSFAERIRLNTPVTQVRRDEQGVDIITAFDTQRYDQVIFACHSDQALDLIEAPTEQESAVLGALRYQANDVILHTDDRLMPQRRKAWASWNYRLDAQDHSMDDCNSGNHNLPVVTYCMNILQSLPTETPVLVSLNAEHLIDESKILQRFNYAHPQYYPATPAAQAARTRISGENRSHFCGAYWYNGFHEDGVRSALDVVDDLIAGDGAKELR